jgi:hypothetical protein
MNSQRDLAHLLKMWVMADDSLSKIEQVAEEI